ncbi:MAG: hypothetical protein VXY93_14630, partial [Pseudomonadota bacterium]|nr:hypothetical protein [Pseudomonadota bacterium]
TLLNVADGATAGITTAPSNVVLTWDVVNQSSSAYRFTGPGQDPTANNPDIYLVRGNKYRFALNASGHPFQIRVSNGGSAYNDGVTNNGAQTGNVEFYVQNDAPASLVYQCTSHGGMVGNIYITGHQLTNGANNRIVTATSAYGMNGEANLTFDGSALTVTGQTNLYGNGGASAVWGNTGYTGHLSYDGSDNAVIRAASGKALIFQTNHVNEKMRITSNGRVSINDGTRSADDANAGATLRVTGTPITRNEDDSPHGHYF